MLSGRVLDLSDPENQEQLIDSVLKENVSNIRLSFVEQHYLDALGEVRIKLEQVLHKRSTISLDGVSVTMIYDNFIRPWQFCAVGAMGSLQLKMKSHEVSTSCVWLAGVPEDIILERMEQEPVQLIRLGGGQRGDKYISTLISDDNDWIVELCIRWNGPPESYWWEYVPSMVNMIF